MFVSLAWRMFHASHAYGYYHLEVQFIARTAIRKSGDVNDGTVTPRMLKKIRWYMVESIVMGEMIASLSSTRLKYRDRRYLVYMGAVMALFDIMTDDFNYGRDRTGRLLHDFFFSDPPEITTGKSASENMCLLYLSYLRESADERQWQEIIDNFKLIDGQLISDKQLQQDAGLDSVNKITADKGGAAILLCSSVLKAKSEKLHRVLYETGGFIQMMNDTQDLYKDTVSGVKTFVHFCSSFNEIFEMLNEKRIVLFRHFLASELPEIAVMRMLFDLNAMFVVIVYKLGRYAETCNFELNFRKISGMKSTDFRIDTFSVSAIKVCAGRILGFSEEKIYYRELSGFNYDNSNHEKQQKN